MKSPPQLHWLVLEKALAAKKSPQRARMIKCSRDLVYVSLCSFVFLRRDLEKLQSHTHTRGAQDILHSSTYVSSISRTVQGKA